MSEDAVAAACREIADRYRARTIALVAIEDVTERGAIARSFATGTQVVDADGPDVELTITGDRAILGALGGRIFFLGRDPFTGGEGGLVVEEAGAEGVVLLRTEAPRFSRLAGELVTTNKGPALRFDRPLLLLHLSRSAAAVLAALPGTAEEVARASGVRVDRVMAIVQTFEARGLVLREGPRQLARPPRVTVVIPAYARPEATRATVLSALALDYPPARLDVLVVDDASPEPLVIEDLPAADRQRVRVLRLEANGGPAAARNAGIAAATSDLVAFLDNDCTADARWLRLLAAALEGAEVDIAGGRAIAPRRAGIVAAYEAARSPLDMGASRGAVGLGERVPYLPSCNLVVRRSAAERLGGFRAGMHLGEDVDFIWRARASEPPSRVVYEPSALVVHHHRETLGATLRRRAEYASSEAKLVQLHPASRRVFYLPITVVLGLAALVVWRFAFLFAVVAGALLLAEVVAKRRTLAGVGVSTEGVGAAIFRAHVASLYHLSAAVSRYLGVPLLALALAVPRLALPVLVLLTIYPAIDARVRRADLALPLYIGMYTLDMTAYQVGVFWGTILHRSLLFPRLAVRR